jgi:hypothetical protein
MIVKHSLEHNLRKNAICTKCQALNIRAIEFEGSGHRMIAGTILWGRRILTSSHLTSSTAKRIFSLLFVICIFLLSLSIQAQDVATDEPVPTQETLLPEPDVLPTELPAITPAPVIIATEEATAAPSPVTVVPEVTTEPTQEVTVEPLPITLTPQATAEAAEPASRPDTLVTLPLLYKATFEGSDAPGLSSTEGWLEVAVDGGKALQNSAEALPVTYTAALNEGAVEARFWLVSGEGQVWLGGYAASLAADGTLTLIRDHVVISSTLVTLTPNTWTLLPGHQRDTDSDQRE